MTYQLKIKNRFEDQFFIRLINRYFFALGVIAEYGGYAFENVVGEFLCHLYLEQDAETYLKDYCENDNAIMTTLCMSGTKKIKRIKREEFDQALLSAKLHVYFSDYFSASSELFKIYRKRIVLTEDNKLAVEILEYRKSLLPLLEKKGITKEEKLYIDFITFDNFKLLINRLPRQQSFFSYYYCKYLAGKETNIDI